MLDRRARAHSLVAPAPFAPPGRRPNFVLLSRAAARLLLKFHRQSAGRARAAGPSVLLCFNIQHSTSIFNIQERPHQLQQAGGAPLRILSGAGLLRAACARPVTSGSGATTANLCVRVRADRRRSFSSVTNINKAARRWRCHFLLAFSLSNRRHIRAPTIRIE